MNHTGQTLNLEALNPQGGIPWGGGGKAYWCLSIGPRLHRRAAETPSKLALIPAWVMEILTLTTKRGPLLEPTQGGAVCAGWKLWSLGVLGVF